MKTKRVLRHAESGREYEVVGVDEARGVVTLRGELAEFTEPLDWERFKAMGYKRKTVEVEDTKH